MAKKDNKGENPVKTYAIVSQLGFNIITPLLIFIWGGSVLVSKMGLPDWVMALFVVIGIFVMLCGTISYLLQLIKRYDKGDDKKVQKVVSSRRDNDYYDDYKFGYYYVPNDFEYFYSDSESSVLKDEKFNTFVASAYYNLDRGYGSNQGDKQYEIVNGWYIYTYIY